MMPLASHDADVNGITWPRRSYGISLWSSWPNEWNGVIDYIVCIMWHWHQHQWHQMTKMLHCTHCFSCLDLRNTMMLLTVPFAWHDADASANSVKLMMPLVSCDANAGITWPKKSRYTLFQLSWPNKQNGSIDSAISIIWCSHRYQQHHLTKGVMPNLVSIVFT